RTRAEVAGGGTKPFRQKGTGRARQGSIRAPQWSGGGVALGPKPRSYRQRTPKKMIRLALCSALADRAAEGRVALVDEWTFEAPRTKDAVAALGALELEGLVLVVLGPEDGIADRSFANLSRVQTLQTAELNAYDVLRSDWVVFTDATVPGDTEAPAAPARGAGKATAPAEASTQAAGPEDAASAAEDATEASGADDATDQEARQ
ncbi:MAG TPA: 50S ribosomal protein L4, partial [Acidimicrobiales bacterium]|nr:50S ribosomal protein L4 [Acidimicrobiales bacterium]